MDLNLGFLERVLKVDEQHGHLKPSNIRKISHIVQRFTPSVYLKAQANLSHIPLQNIPISIFYYVLPFLVSDSK